MLRQFNCRHPFIFRCIAALAAIPLCSQSGAAADRLSGEGPPPAETTPEAGAGKEGEDPDRIIVLGSRIPLPEERVGSAVTLIGEEEIEARKETFALDLLRGVPSAAVTRTGGFGGLTQLRLRGAEANQTLVLIDGVEVADPVSGEFDLSDVLTADIARIEVVRGEQSALWGSEAVGGVVNIITKEGEGPPRINAGFRYGSFDTKQFRGSAATGTEHYSARISGAFFESEGINVSRTGSEPDGYRNGTVYFKGSLTPADSLTLDVAARYVNALNREDSGFPQPVDTDTVGRREQVSARAGATLSLMGGDWLHKAAVSVNDVASRALESGALTSESHGRRLRASYQSDLFFRPAFLPDTEHRLTLYAEREALTFENASIFSSVPLHEAETVNRGYVAEYGIGFGEIAHLTGSVRHDDNEDFENALTFRTTAAIHLGGRTRVHASAGTGVRNPGFFDLFGFDPGFFVGNADLKPEQSFGWDAGVEHGFLGGRLSADVTWFQSRLDDEIVLVFVPPSPDLPGFPFGALTPVNADLEGERRGVEASVRAQFTESWSLTAAYTWTEATENGEEEVRRPAHMASLSTTYLFLDGKADATLSADYTGAFRDFDFTVFPTARVEMDSFLLLGLAARYRLNDSVEFYLRGDNLLDQDYEEVLFFQTPGIAVTGGFTVSTGIGG
ncbi:MAG: TonB-dependent receptor plug domain-containing protein [Alphaproteobacteria bacterium]